MQDALPIFAPDEQKLTGGERSMPGVTRHPQIPIYRLCQSQPWPSGAPLDETL